MNILKKSIKITATVIIFGFLLIATIVVLVWYNNTDDAKLLAILGSLFAGSIIAIIQFVIAWQDYNQTEKLKELELIKVLYDRADRLFYEEYIKRSKKKIYMMGVTGSRFFDDFADYSQNAPSTAKVLIDAMLRGVKIRILLPAVEFIEDGRKKDVEKVKQHVEGLMKEHPRLPLEIKYFKHVPTHSIFNVDDNCIVGPVFPELESKYTPALYLRNSSPIAHRYLNYFEYEWGKAE